MCGVNETPASIGVKCGVDETHARNSRACYHGVGLHPLSFWVICLEQFGLCRSLYLQSVVISVVISVVLSVVITVVISPIRCYISNLRGFHQAEIVSLVLA